MAARKKSREESNGENISGGIKEIKKGNRRAKAAMTMAAASEERNDHRKIINKSAQSQRKKGVKNGIAAYGGDHQQNRT